MAAIAACVLFALALILQISNADVPIAFAPTTLVIAGLFAVALHLAYPTRKP